ncbi:MPN domain-containing protein-like, partial [Tropilaelaps mercedesae]
ACELNQLDSFMDMSTAGTGSAGEDGLSTTAISGEVDKSSTPSGGGTPDYQVAKTAEEPAQPLKITDEVVHVLYQFVDIYSIGEREEREVRKLTLETLLREGVLESGDGVLSMEYMASR